MRLGVGDDQAPVRGCERRHRGSLSICQRRGGEVIFDTGRRGVIFTKYISYNQCGSHMWIMWIIMDPTYMLPMSRVQTNKITLIFWTVAPFPICGVSYMKKYQMSP